MAAPVVREIAVIGGGITGLAAAQALLDEPGTVVSVFEADAHVGGKLRASEVAGVLVDEGAESMLAVRPEATGLAADVGLRPSIVHPATQSAAVLSHGHLRPLPPGLVSGVPTDLRALAASRVMSTRGLLRLPLDQCMGRPTLTEDVSVGEFVGHRLGREVVDRLVEPLLAGVYAGNPDQLSLRMANPSLYRQLARDESLLAAAAATRSGSAVAAGARRGPAFAGLRGGVARLAAKTADSVRAAGGLILTETPVERLRRVRRRWEVHTAAGAREFDAVVVAVPASQAAALLRTSAPFSAMQIMAIDYASVAVVTLAYPSSEVGKLDGSGFLVPPVEGYSIKGVTYSTNKWEWLAREARSSSPRGMVLVRASLGRYGDAEVLEHDDAELAALVRADLAAIVGLVPATLAERVTRWDNALPQYRVGHVELVQRARAALVDSPGVALAGAAYDGVGIASCIASGRQAARKVVRDLVENGVQAHG
ncbi:MAG: protoporphyrinogen oxidase [Candidatus Nanopelagicales bacterium]